MALTRLGSNQSVNLASNVTGTLPVANGGTAITSGFKNGITEHDEWRLTSDKSVSNTISSITSNLARTTREGFSLLGTGMTESSGIFTFPSTGYYIVGLNNSYTTTDANRSNSLRIYVTENNSTYRNIGAAGVNVSDDGGSSNSYGSVFAEFEIDVTDTSNVKVKFSTDVSDNAIYTAGNSNRSDNQMLFIRLGDT